jgi:hypothetical protein
VTPSAVRVAAYRFRATFSQRWGEYVTLVVLIGLLGGVALGALAGARRTQSSYATYLASTNPYDLQTFTAFANPALDSSLGYDPAAVARVLRAPYVQSEQSVVGFDGNLAFVHGTHPDPQAGEKPPGIEGALGGEYTTQDRASLVAGRYANPRDPGEAVMNAQAASEWGLHLGSVLQIGLNSEAQEDYINTPTGPSSLPPVKVATVRMVGVVVLPQDVDEDDYSALGSATILLTPALTRQIAGCCSYYTYTSLKLDGGTAHLAAVEAALGHARLPTLDLGGFQTHAPAVAAANRAIRPVSVALAVFGGLAALSLLFVVTQVVSRQLRRHGGETATLRALGAGPRVTAGDAMAGIVGAGLVGAACAVGVAVALSPLFPLGPVRSVYPVSVGADWTVLGLGFAAMLLAVLAVAGIEAYRFDPHRRQLRMGRVRRPSAVAQLAAGSGLPASAVTGIRFAVEPGDRDPVPVRSAILGATLAVVVVLGTVVFGASLNNLVTHPDLYGWNWNYTLLSGFAGDEDLPAQQSTTLLAHDHYVTAASGVYFVKIDIDGQDTGALGASPNAPVAPPLLSGHGLQGADQIVLGTATMEQLGKRVGDTVLVGGGHGRTTRLTIVGTATMPALVGNGMGDGAIVDYRLIPPAVRNTQGSAVPGPNAFLVRTDGPPAQARRSLDAIVATINNANSPSPGSAGGVIAVLRPEEIVDSHSIVAIPAILGTSLAVGAALALATTLVASVRRRRRDLAVLKTLGMAGRQLGGIVAWQSTVTVLFGTVVGVPLGLVLGHVLWNAFAEAIHAVPVTSIPGAYVALIAVGAIVLANVVAAVPARLAARTRTAVLLRSE